MDSLASLIVECILQIHVIVPGEIIYVNNMNVLLGSTVVIITCKVHTAREPGPHDLRQRLQRFTFRGVEQHRFRVPEWSGISIKCDLNFSG